MPFLKIIIGKSGLYRNLDFPYRLDVFIEIFSSYHNKFFNKLN
ncbi:hypothetical protein [Cetobacterium somerae]